MSAGDASWEYHSVEVQGQGWKKGHFFTEKKLKVAVVEWSWSGEGRRGRRTSVSFQRKKFTTHFQKKRREKMATSSPNPVSPTSPRQTRRAPPTRSASISGSTGARPKLCRSAVFARLLRVCLPACWFFFRRWSLENLSNLREGYVKDLRKQHQPAGQRDESYPFMITERRRGRLGSLAETGEVTRALEAHSAHAHAPVSEQLTSGMRRPLSTSPPGPGE